jgi:hypothetical protein
MLTRLEKSRARHCANSLREAFSEKIRFYIYAITNRTFSIETFFENTTYLKTLEYYNHHTLYFYVPKDLETTHYNFSGLVKITENGQPIAQVSEDKESVGQMSEVGEPSPEMRKFEFKLTNLHNRTFTIDRNSSECDIYELANAIVISGLKEYLKYDGLSLLLTLFNGFEANTIKSPEERRREQENPETDQERIQREKAKSAQEKIRFKAAVLKVITTGEPKEEQKQAIDELYDTLEKFVNEETKRLDGSTMLELQAHSEILELVGRIDQTFVDQCLENWKNIDPLVHLFIKFNFSNQTLEQFQDSVLVPLGCSDPTEEKQHAIAKLYYALKHFADKNDDKTLSFEQMEMLKNNSPFMQFMGWICSLLPELLQIGLIADCKHIYYLSRFQEEALPVHTGPSSQISR